MQLLEFSHAKRTFGIESYKHWVFNPKVSEFYYVGVSVSWHRVKKHISRDRLLKFHTMGTLRRIFRHAGEKTCKWWPVF